MRSGSINFVVVVVENMVLKVSVGGVFLGGEVLVLVYLEVHLFLDRVIVIF